MENSVALKFHVNQLAAYQHCCACNSNETLSEGGNKNQNAVA